MSFKVGDVVQANEDFEVNAWPSSLQGYPKHAVTIVSAKKDIWVTVRFDPKEKAAFWVDDGPLVGWPSDEYGPGHYWAVPPEAVESVTRKLTPKEVDETVDDFMDELLELAEG
jgi:hypothetical protein